MIKDKQRNDLIKYRIEQAKATKNEAKLMIENDMFRGAINRIYYGMFYMVLALALKYGFDSSKHGQLIGWFNKTFIKEAIIERRFGRPGTVLLRITFSFISFRIALTASYE